MKKDDKVEEYIHALNMATLLIFEGLGALLVALHLPRYSSYLAIVTFVMLFGWSPIYFHQILVLVRIRQEVKMAEVEE